MKVTHTYDHFYRHGEITQIVQKYAADYPQFVRLSALDKTPEGREIWCIELTDTSTGSFEEKPAYYVDANIHAGEVTGSMCAMYFLDYLLTNSSEPEVAELLKRCTFYVIPRISPDGSECYLTTPEIIRSVNRMYPNEELMPGLQPKDMDGDGLILKMRVKSPYGAWKQSPKDPRLMTKRQPDDVEGEFYHVFSEGYIEDYDGIQIKQAPGKWGNDFNRNFPIAWVPENEQKGSGVYPLHNPETRTIADFLAGHKNICTVIDLHTMSGLYLYPPGIKPVKDAFKNDMRRYEEIGKMANEETTYPCVNIHDGYMPKDAPLCAGSLDDFCHFNLGIPAYTIECWDLNPRAGIPFVFPQRSEIPDDELEEQHLKYLKWIDKNLDGEGCKPWTKFVHPQLGEVEIGGIDYKHVVQNCPIKFLQQELEKHTRFMLRHAKTLPRLSFRQVKTDKIDDSTYKVTACVMNAGYFPTYISDEALKLKIAKELKISLSGDVAFAMGKQTQEIGHLEGFSGIKASNSTLGANTIMGDPCEKEVSWVIKAKPGTTLTLTCCGQKTGTISQTITL